MSKIPAVEELSRAWKPSQQPNKTHRRHSKWLRGTEFAFGI